MILFSFLLLPLETLLGQMGPIWLLQKMGIKLKAILILLPACLFGILHLSSGLTGWFVGFGAGVPLAMCYLYWKRESSSFAFWNTTLVHVIHNIIATMVYAFEKSLS